jgi:cytochrome P450
MGLFFFEYLSDRRENPRDDLLTQLALATYPDGELPDLIEMVKLSGFLFGAGQDTSAKLLSNAMRHLVEVPGLQDQLRKDHSLVPDMLEEVLRLEGSTKVTFRIARRNTTVGGRAVPAGTRLTVALAAANRDPRRWENPDEFRLGRPRIKEHLGFGRGVHTCAGAPLARLEVAEIIEQFLAHTSHIGLSAAHHGPPGQRRLDYEPSYIIRGLARLHLDLRR